MNNTTDYQARLDAWNDEIVDILLPSYTILSIYLVLGILGNVAVLYIYGFRLKSVNDDRMLIPVLALFDLLSCITGTISFLAYDLLPVKFDNDVACKVSVFVMMVFAEMSVLMLVIIAINRYRKICRPFGRQMTRFWKKVSVALIAVISLLYSWPCFLFYGVKDFYSETQKLVGHRCTNIQGPWSPTEALVFKVFILLEVAVILVTLAVLYQQIGMKILKIVKSEKRLFSQGLSNSDTATAETMDHTTNTSPVPSFELQPPRRQTTSYDQQLPGIRLALMFMVITFAFFICGFSKVILMVYESVNKDFWVEISNDKIAGCRILYYLFWVNNIINPVIYGFMDKQFRREAIALFCPCAKI